MLVLSPLSSLEEGLGTRLPRCLCHNLNPWICQTKLKIGLLAGQISVGNIVLRVGIIVLRVGNIVLRVGSIVLRVGNIVLRVGNIVLWVGNIVLRVGSIVLRVGIIVLQVGNIVLRVGNIVLRVEDCFGLNKYTLGLFSSRIVIQVNKRENLQTKHGIG